MKRMIRYSWAMAAMALFFVVVGAAAAQERKGPRIELNEERFDFGKVEAGATAVHIFEIRNAGDEVLEISKVQTS